MATKPKGTTKKDIEVANSQARQMAVDMQAMDDIAAIEEKTKMLQQEGLNKQHDTEFSPYSDVNGQNQGQMNLGVIGENEIKKAFDTLQKYKEDKAELEEKLLTDEKCWELLHWEVLYNKQNKASDKRIKPISAWLFNTIINKHADAMDNFPEPNVLPRVKDDEQTAKVISEILPVILEQNDFESCYSDSSWDKNKNGTSVTGVFWNNDKNNGLGDIDIKNIDLMKIYWKSGVKDIQDSPNVFVVEVMENEEIKARYPEIGDINGSEQDVTHYYYGEKVDTSNTSSVIDWYYRRRIKTINDMGIPQMKTVVHFCKFCNGKVIYASENDPNYAETGWYAHGQYPFVFDVLFPKKASCVGIGYIDLIKDDQMYIDKLQQAILENAIAGARPRTAVRTDAGLNEEEYQDVENPIVHFEGNLGEDAFRPIQSSALAPIYMNTYLQKIQEMKDTSGNTAASQGQTSNVTTASGIASLQEAAGKLSRDATGTTYRAFKQICYLVIELMRQFYTEQRCFRIIGENGQPEYVEFDNSGLQPKMQQSIIGENGQVIDLGSREPILDIEVKPQKRSAYSKETQNQTALQLYNMGFFAPNNADASLACLDMMEFDGVEKIKEKVQSNGLMFQQLMQLQMLLQQLAANNPELQAALGMNMQATAESGNPSGSGTGTAQKSRGSLSSQAANATRESTAPRS